MLTHNFKRYFIGIYANKLALKALDKEKAVLLAFYDLHQIKQSFNTHHSVNLLKQVYTETVEQY